MGDARTREEWRKIRRKLAFTCLEQEQEKSEEKWEESLHLLAWKKKSLQLLVLAQNFQVKSLPYAHTTKQFKFKLKLQVQKGSVFGL